MRKHVLLKRIAILISFNNLLEIVDIFSLNLLLLNRHSFSDCFYQKTYSTQQESC